jgi:hypothetical protein
MLGAKPPAVTQEVAVYLIVIAIVYAANFAIAFRSVSITAQGAGLAYSRGRLQIPFSGVVFR